MERKYIRLRRDELLRTRFLKREYYYIILKSIGTERSVPPIVRFHARIMLDKNIFYISR